MIEHKGTRYIEEKYENRAEGILEKQICQLLKRTYRNYHKIKQVLQSKTEKEEQKMYQNLKHKRTLDVSLCLNGLS